MEGHRQPRAAGAPGLPAPPAPYPGAQGGAGGQGGGWGPAGEGPKRKPAFEPALHAPGAPAWPEAAAGAGWGGLARAKKRCARGGELPTAGGRRRPALEPALGWLGAPAASLPSPLLHPAPVGPDGHNPGL